MIDPDYKIALLAQYGGRNSISAAAGVSPVSFAGENTLVTISTPPPVGLGTLPPAADGGAAALSESRVGGADDEAPGVTAGWG